MVKEPMTIAIDPGSELARALADAAEQPVRLDVNGVLYRISRESADDPWAGYDPAKVRAGLRRFAGTIRVEDAQRLKALIYRGREDGTRPPDRP